MSGKRRTGDGGINPYPVEKKKKPGDNYGMPVAVADYETTLGRKSTLKLDQPSITSACRIDQFTGEVQEIKLRPRNPLSEKWRSQGGDPGEGSEDP